MSDATHGHGAGLFYGTTTQPTSATRIANVSNADHSGISRDALDVSTMDSTSKHREFIPGMIDAGELSATLNYDGSAAGEANSLLGASGIYTASAYTWWLTMGDGGTNTAVTSNSYLQCSGFITSLGHAVPYDDKVTQSITVKLTGVPTYTDLA